MVSPRCCTSIMATTPQIGTTTPISAILSMKTLSAIFNWYVIYSTFCCSSMSYTYEWLWKANYLLHHNYPGIVTIAEGAAYPCQACHSRLNSCMFSDVSGMAGLCRPVEDGGVGFDYRLGMGIPDMWAKMCTEVEVLPQTLASCIHPYLLYGVPIHRTETGVCKALHGI